MFGFLVLECRIEPKPRALVDKVTINPYRKLNLIYK